MNELEPGIDRRFRGFDIRRMIEVDIHLDVKLGPVVVDHRTEVSQADHLDLAVARLHENRTLFRGGGSGDRDERFLVVDVEGAQGKAFLPRPSVQSASGFRVRHEKTPFHISGSINQDLNDSSSVPDRDPGMPVAEIDARPDPCSASSSPRPYACCDTWPPISETMVNAHCVV